MQSRSQAAGKLWAQGSLVPGKVQPGEGGWPVSTAVVARQCLVFMENCVHIHFHRAAKKDAWSWEMIIQ